MGLASFILHAIGSRQSPGDREDWQVGDIAECIHAGDWFIGGVVRTEVGPKYGDRHRVTEVHGASRKRKRRGHFLYLRFNRFEERSYTSEGFRKVRPHADEAIAADDAFIDKYILEPETVARFNRWQLRAELAIITAAALICCDAWLGALTRGPA